TILWSAKRLPFSTNRARAGIARHDDYIRGIPGESKTARTRAACKLCGVSGRATPELRSRRRRATVGRAASAPAFGLRRVRRLVPRARARARRGAPAARLDDAARRHPELHP